MKIIHHILEIISPKQRWTLVALLGLMLVGMVLETVGVGSMIPLIATLSSSDVGANLPAWMPFRATLSQLSDVSLATLAMSLLVGLFLVKAMFLAFLVWRQATFLYGAQAEVSQRLFNGYMHQTYAFHLRRNSSELIRNITTETGAFTLGALQAGMLMATEALVAVGIAGLLLVVEPVGAAVVVVTLVASGAGFLLLTRQRLKIWGEMRQLHEGRRLQHVQQGLAGVKDVKLLGREGHFIDQYSAHNFAVARMGKREMVAQALPRLWLELLAVIGLSVLVMTLIAQGKSLDSIVPVLGVFAAAAYRLIPSANRIVNGMQGLRYYLPVVNTLHGELHQLAQGTAAPLTGELPLRHAITVHGLRYVYPESEKPAVQVDEIRIERGTSVGFIGESGAGKSTLIDLLMGLLIPNAGLIASDGVDILSNIRAWQSNFGYVPQSIFLTDDTLRRNIAFGLPDDDISESQVVDAVNAAQLKELVDSLPEGLDTLVGERGVRLSGGQRQRIGIARALYHRPNILVLDEATSALDVQTELEVMREVNLLQGKTIIIVAHRYSTVANCDVIVRLEKGRVIASGPPAKMLPGH